MKNAVICIIILMTAGSYARAQSNPASAVPPSPIAPGAAPATISPENQKELDALRTKAAQLKTQIALLQDRLNTYKSWLLHGVTSAQRQEINDKMEATKEQMVPYQTQLAAVQDKMKTIDPTSVPAASPGSSPGASAWPFSH